MNLRCADIGLDFSRMDAAARDYIPADTSAAIQKIRSWWQGDLINDSEQRAAMHMVLRAQPDAAFQNEFLKPVIAERKRMKELVESCDAEHVLHIGIGGSDLGPRLVADALRGDDKKAIRRIDFLSSLTPTALERAISKLNPQNSIVILASKSFGTAEIKYITELLTNQFSWPLDRVLVVTARHDLAEQAGFLPDNIVSLWDWVGGRYSLWSGVGLSIALTYGWDVFEKLLAGAARIDNDFIGNLENSAPFRLACVLQAQRIMNRRPGLAILPYHADLGLLPSHLQQLIMESNGKPGHATAPIVFGVPGTEFQHSFGQFLHQGPDLCTPLFITVADQGDGWRQSATAWLLANASAQADVLWHGKPDADPAKILPGNRPSVTLSLPRLDAGTLGQLLALFEHTTVCDAFLSGINPFDQWGIEAGKKLAQERLGNGS